MHKSTIHHVYKLTHKASALRFMQNKLWTGRNLEVRTPAPSVTIVANGHSLSSHSLLCPICWDFTGFCLTSALRVVILFDGAKNLRSLNAVRCENMPPGRLNVFEQNDIYFDQEFDLYCFPSGTDDKVETNILPEKMSITERLKEFSVWCISSEWNYTWVEEI